MPTPTVQLPTDNTTNANIKLGQNKDDYKKFVIVDTAGSLVEKGQVLQGFDIIKDENLEAKEQFFKEMFAMFGFEFKERESVQKVVAKGVSPAELLAKFNKGN